MIALFGVESVTLTNKGGREQRFLLFVFLVALVLRLGYVLFFPWDFAGRKFDPQQLYQDERVYDETATNLLAGKGFVSSSDVSVLPPTYPLFLAAVYAVFGHSFTAVRFVQVILSALTCVVVYYLGKAVFNKGAGRVAALMAVCYPFFFAWTRALLTETLTAFLVALGVLWLRKTASQPSAVNRFVTGCIWGSAALLRGNLLICLPLLLLWPLLEFSLNCRALGLGLGVVTVAALVVLPWTLRNYIAHRRLVLVSSHGGLNIYLANNPYSAPYEPYGSDTNYLEPEDAEMVDGPVSIETDNALMSRAVGYIVDHPRIFLWSAYGRLSVFWRPVTLNTVREKLGPHTGLSGLSSLAVRLGLPFLVVADGLILGLAYVGLFTALHKRRARALYITVIALCAVHLVATVVGNGRFRLPLMPLLIVFAGYAVYAFATLPGRVVEQRRPSVPKDWILLLVLVALMIPIGRALGLGNELRPVEGPPYEVESFEGVTAPPDGDDGAIAETGWTYYRAPHYSGGHAALTAAVDRSIRQRIERLSPGDYELNVTVGTHPDDASSIEEENRLEVKLNGTSQILEWSNGGQDWQRLGLIFFDVPAGNTLDLKSLAIGGRFVVVDKVELEKR
jgi:4-amino-4-deoxy-L-arabinose transferase-like glycosyltransferase